MGLPNTGMQKRFQAAMTEARLAEDTAIAKIASKIAKTTPATVGNWRRGQVTLQHAKAAQCFGIARALNVRPEWLLLGEEPMHQADAVNPDDAHQARLIATATAVALADALARTTPTLARAFRDSLAERLPGELHTTGQALASIVERYLATDELASLLGSPPKPSSTGV